MNDNIRLKMVLVGIPSSGKTVYLAMLKYYIENYHFTRYYIECDERTKNYLNTIVEYIVERHQFPPPTAPGQQQKIEFSVVDTETERRLSIQTADLSGEDFSKVAGPDFDKSPFAKFLHFCTKYGSREAMLKMTARLSSETLETFRRFKDLINSADAFLLMLDPFPEVSYSNIDSVAADEKQLVIWQAYQDLVMHATLCMVREKHHGAKALTKKTVVHDPIAVVMTKSDLFNGRNFDIVKHVKHKLLNATYPIQSPIFSKLHIFAVSAVGSTRLVKVDGEEVLAPAEVVEPSNVFKPISWLVEALSEKND